MDYTLEVMGYDAKAEVTTRGHVLMKAANLTVGDRNQQYGDPTTQMEFTGKLVQLYLDYGGDKRTKAHNAAMALVFNKISRIAMGVFKDDNYVDAAAYLAIAFEAEMRLRGPQEDSNDS